MFVSIGMQIRIDIRELRKSEAHAEIKALRLSERQIDTGFEEICYLWLCSFSIYQILLFRKVGNLNQGQKTCYADSAQWSIISEGLLSFYCSWNQWQRNQYQSSLNLVLYGNHLSVAMTLRYWLMRKENSTWEESDSAWFLVGATRSVIRIFVFLF